MFARFSFKDASKVYSTFVLRILHTGQWNMLKDIFSGVKHHKLVKINMIKIIKTVSLEVQMICFPIHQQPWYAFLTNEWYGFSAYHDNLFNKVHRITNKRDLKVTCHNNTVSLRWYVFLWSLGSSVIYKRPLTKHFNLLSKSTSVLNIKRKHIILFYSDIILISRFCNNVCLQNDLGVFV